uniref:7.9 kDa putative secretory protein n=1 Tax=Argas monolakensis TaxID=34602 RepID=Q09JX3_ARGMO|nr:7.9 kDa putative secretory protein [Argas monolakensis]
MAARGTHILLVLFVCLSVIMTVSPLGIRKLLFFESSYQCSGSCTVNSDCDTALGCVCGTSNGNKYCFDPTPLGK